MKTVKIASLKDGLSATLRLVQNGERVLVTDRSRPVAVLSPVEDEDGVTIIAAQQPFAAIRRKRFPPTRRRVDSLAALLEERGPR